MLVDSIQAFHLTSLFDIHFAIRYFVLSLYFCDKKFPPVFSCSVSQFCDVRDCGGGAVDKSVGPASGRLGVRNPAATDLSRKKGSDRSTAKRSAIGVRVTGPRSPRSYDAPCYIRCGTLKNPHCSMAMSTEHR